LVVTLAEHYADLTGRRFPTLMAASQESTQVLIVDIILYS